MDDITRTGNLIEAGLWLGFTAIFAFKARRAVAFPVFCVSVVIE